MRRGSIFLAQVDPPFARRIYTVLAENPDPYGRQAFTGNVSNLLPVDHDASLALWDHLVRDPDPEVRRAAYDELTNEIGDPSLDPEEQNDIERAVVHLSLTWQDVAHLSRAYIEAEHDPATRYQPGAAAQEGDTAND